MFDVFIVSLKCPCCNAITEQVDIQTHIRSEGDKIKIGFKFDVRDLTLKNISDEYLLINPCDLNQSIKLIDLWFCKICETEQWAVLEITNQLFSGAHAIKLNRFTLESANFINHLEAELLARSFLNKPFDTISNSVQVLREMLP